MYRTTSKTHIVPPDLDVRFTEIRGSRNVTWVAQRIEEVLTEGEDTPSGRYTYRVTVRGSVLKKDGTVGNVPANRSFTEPTPVYVIGRAYGIDQIPDELFKLLLGRDTLRHWKFDT